MQANKIVTYGPRISVVRDEPDELYKGVIIIPEEGKAKPIRGRVVMIGLGVDEHDMNSSAYGLRLGDHVTFSKYNGILFDLDPDDGKGVVNVECFHESDLYIGIGLS